VEKHSISAGLNVSASSAFRASVQRVSFSASISGPAARRYARALRGRQRQRGRGIGPIRRNCSQLYSRLGAWFSKASGIQSARAQFRGTTFCPTISTMCSSSCPKSVRASFPLSTQPLCLSGRYRITKTAEKPTELKVSTREIYRGGDRVRSRADHNREPFRANVPQHRFLSMSRRGAGIVRPLDGSRSGWSSCVPLRRPPAGPSAF
jgi:hypothetical protein